jgi:drug/metabolite transporter (DMT)-like permease
MNRRAVVLGLLSAALFRVSTPAVKVLLGTIDPAILAALLYCGAGLAVAVVRRLGQFSVAKTGRSEAALGSADVPYLAGAIVAGGIAGPILLMLGLQRTGASVASARRLSGLWRQSRAVRLCLASSGDFPDGRLLLHRSVPGRDRRPVAVT